MVSLATIRASNVLLSTHLPSSPTILFIGATSGISLSILQHISQYADAPHIYSVARPPSAPAHQALLSILQEQHPTSTYTLIEADPTLLSSIPKITSTLTTHESKLDMLIFSAGHLSFEGRANTAEGLDPGMALGYYSRLLTLHSLLPLLNKSPNPRVLSVLAGGMEAPLNESDLDLREPENWSVMAAAFQGATMGTLSLEHLAQQNPELSIVHWAPGVVDTPSLARARKFGVPAAAAEAMSAEEAGERGLFYVTSERYSVNDGIVPIEDGVEKATKSAGGIFLVGADGESKDSEAVLAPMRERGVPTKVWEFTLGIFEETLKLGGD
ncbi:short-chain dehydrogenase/reductase [Amniculicola lignicola CBS 123094]|uniref:Short-chain dehydrogenase/reductase n=1 Tax=Amniculicola lignicola CBS 123094 TaxID=1392246 RepID=A0A6A5WCX4_9PLEO|nr:short-chain dehydrogenase/reductase [Amniculicola lignicola CBS 123094]